MPGSKIIFLQEELFNWFEINGRKFSWREKNIPCFNKILAEILLQRTKAENVQNHFSTFIEKYYSWKTISLSSEENLQNDLKPFGLWKRRAKSLKNLSAEMEKRDGIFPNERESLERLPGIGQYLANSILLLCYGQPEALIDVNMVRILDRFFGPRKKVDFRYDNEIQLLAKSLISCKDPIEENFAFLDFAALVCKINNPHCNKCPLTLHCLFFKSVNYANPN